MQRRSTVTPVLACIAALLFWTHFYVFLKDRLKDDPIIPCAVGLEPSTITPEHGLTGRLSGPHTVAIPEPIHLDGRNTAKVVPHIVMHHENRGGG